MSKVKKSRKKKSGYKKVFKGVRYIANVLVKYYNKRYPNYTSALVKSKEVYDSLKSSGTKVTVKSIKGLVSKKREPKKLEVPYIDQSLLKVINYFDLVDYPAYILRSSNLIKFKSDLIPSGVREIVGGNKIDYSVYFAPYVNYINRMVSLDKKSSNRYETEWLVVCTKPYYDLAKKQWYSDIISIDIDEVEVNYGFNPDLPSEVPSELIVTGALPSEVVVPVIDTTKKSDIEKEIELEKEKQKTIEEKMKAFRELKESGMTIEQINKFLGL